MADDALLPGRWTVTKPACACVCPPPGDVQVWYTYFPGSPLSQWIPSTSGGAGDSYTPSSTHQELDGGGDAHAIAYVQFRYDGADGTPRFMRYRLLTVTETGAAPDSYTVSEDRFLFDHAGIGIFQTNSGEDTIVIEDPGPATSGTLVNYFTGPAGKVELLLERITRFASLDKKGFAPYFGLTDAEVKFYRTETVGPESGFAGTPSQPTRLYSGHQRFSANDAGTDPAGAYENTLSRDLRRDGFASAPLGDARLALSFGSVTNTETRRVMTRSFPSGETTVEQLLVLELSDEYTTSELEATADANLAGQLATTEPGTGLIAIERLTNGEAHLERRTGSAKFTAPAPYLYVQPGEELAVEVRWIRRTINLTTGLATDQQQTHVFVCSVPPAEPGDPPRAPGLGRLSTADPDFQFGVVATDGTLVEIVELATDANPAIATGFVVETIV